MSLSFYQEKGQFEATDRGAPRKGYKDVTIIQSLDMYGEDEEIKLTEDYLPSRKKTDEKTLQAYDGEALLIRRIVQKYNDREVLTRSELRIQSETLCAAFREIVMYTYDSLDIGTTPIIIPSPFFELFFKRKEIAAYLDNEDKDQSLRAEVRLLHNFIQEDKVTVSKLDEYNSLLRQKTVSYNNLWTLFPPNELLILNNDAAPECWLCRNVVAVPKKVEWLVTGVRLDFDGHNIGLIRQTCSISFRDRLNGTMEISQLPIVPVRYFDGWDIMRAKLIERGRRYQQFMGTNLDSHAYLHYKGPLWESDDLSAKAKSKINQRVMVDYMAYFNRQPKKTAILDRQDRETPSGMNLFDPNPCSDLRLEPETNFSSTAKINPNDGQDIAEIASLQANGEDYDVFSRLLQKLSARYGMTNGLDDLFILCPARIPGYGLTTKEWGWMLVDNLTEIKHSPLAFESLRIDPEIKSLIEALVQGHQSGDPDDFDDVITGKGKGLVMLLYGNPGTGKTLTAESISELRKSPLYVVSGGELSVDVSQVEVKLNDVFDLGKRWNAVVLLDEADVVMSKRSSNDLERNAITAVWLRKLEYFEGILFLTTNRSGDFDEAFQSRIHLKISLPELGPLERAAIWRRHVCPNKNASIWTEEIFQTLAKMNLNGREIKNLVRTTNYYARSTKESLALRHICGVLKVEHSTRVKIADISQELKELEEEALADKTLPLIASQVAMPSV